MGTGPSCVACSAAECCPPPEDGEHDPSGQTAYVESLSVLDWGPGNEPVGQVFEETLSHLGALDRELLLFCATSCLSAVRWLLHLGACMDAVDANGTTCLHVACRAGGLAVVCEIMEHLPLLEAMDMASWTPLHIAAHMGRREVAARLLRARASPEWRNARGQRPSDLCKDSSTLRVLQGDWVLDEGADGRLLASSKADDDIVGIPELCEPECFFVSPMPVFRTSSADKTALLHIAALIFRLRPSHGLAFAVVSGAMESYTGAMRAFLQFGSHSRVQLGSFLGEALSLSKLLRFSVFDSIPLLYTGVLSSLSEAFMVLQLPEDLQKIDRIVRSLAYVWWRKHRALGETYGETGNPVSRAFERKTEPRQPLPVMWMGDTSRQPEFAGLELMQYLASSDVLCQLMLSTVLLHWYVHNNDNVGAPPRHLPFETWMALNRGIELGGADVPGHVQRRIYDDVCGRFRRELSLATTLQPQAACAASSAAAVASSDEGGDPAAEPKAPCPMPAAASVPLAPGAIVLVNAAASVPGGAPPDAVPRMPGAEQATPGASLTAGLGLGRETRLVALAQCAQVQGWVQLLEGAPPCPEAMGGLANSREGCERTSMSCWAGSLQAASAASEALSTEPKAASPLFQSSAWAAPQPSVPPPEEQVWASLCHVFLFFAAAPGGSTSAAPYAMTDARQLKVSQVDSASRTLTLQGVGGKDLGQGRDPPLLFAVLLSDGRWLEVKVKRVVLKVEKDEELPLWVAKLVHASVSSQLRTV